MKYFSHFSWKDKEKKRKREGTKLRIYKLKGGSLKTAKILSTARKKL